MKKSLSIFKQPQTQLIGIITCLLLITGCSPSPSEQAQAQFLEQYQKHQASKNIEGILSLYHWEDVEKDYRKVLRLGLMNEIEYPILDIRFVPLETGDDYDYEFDNKHYRPNLKPTLKLHIQYDVPERLNSTFIAGLHEGNYYLINPKITPVE